MKVAKVTKTTKASEFKRAPRNLSHDESEVVSSYAILAMEFMDDEEFVLRIETKITTRNMQIETGAMILTISSPKLSRTLGEESLCLCVCAIIANRVQLQIEKRSVSYFTVMLWLTFPAHAHTPPPSNYGPAQTLQTMDLSPYFLKKKKLGAFPDTLCCYINPFP